MTINTIDELYEAISNGKYDVEYVRPKYLRENTVIDEEKSVRWNREEVQRRNNEQMEKAKENKEKRRELSSKRENDIVRVFVNETGYSEEKVRAIYNYAYMKSHSSGMYEVVQALDELINLFMKVDKIK